jgi:hypothetical protein
LEDKGRHIKVAFLFETSNWPAFIKNIFNGAADFFLTVAALLINRLTAIMAV